MKDIAVAKASRAVDPDRTWPAEDTGRRVAVHFEPSVVKMAKGFAVVLGAIVLSLFITIWVFIFANELAIIGLPSDEQGAANLQEAFARAFLLLAALTLTALGFRNQSGRGPVFSHRWHIVAVVVFWLGLLSALGDPFHGVFREYNWIRYWTAGALILAGVIGLENALAYREIPIARVIGGCLGTLLLLAGGDEMFELHEKFDTIATASMGQDLPTFAAAVAAVAVLAVLLVLYQRAPRILSDMRGPRFTLPIMLFVFAVVSFAAAMMLDTFDRPLALSADAIGLPNGYHTLVTGVVFWHYLIDVRVVTYSLEEVLEYLSAVCLMMSMGMLFFLRWLGSPKKMHNNAWPLRYRGVRCFAVLGTTEMVGPKVSLPQLRS